MGIQRLRDEVTAVLARGTVNKIALYTGLNKGGISRLKSGKRDVSGITLETAEKIAAIADRILKTNGDGKNAQN